MWSWIVIYECKGTRYVKAGGKYHAEMIARYLMSAFLRGLTREQQLVDFKILYIPKEEDEQTCL
jgi:hypothetical protein